MSKLNRVQLLVIRWQQTPHLCLAIFNETLTWALAARLEGVGLFHVRRLQRWWRLQHWRPRAVAFMMATTARLGTESSLKLLDNDLLRLCLAMP